VTVTPRLSKLFTGYARFVRASPGITRSTFSGRKGTVLAVYLDEITQLHRLYR
jgi:hypothetical protein